MNQSLRRIQQALNSGAAHGRRLPRIVQGAGSARDMVWGHVTVPLVWRPDAAGLCAGR